MLNPFTIKQQYIRVFYLGVSFMMMFTSYNSLQNIVSKVYDDHLLKNMGQILLMCIYAAFGITTFFSSFIVKKFGFKKCFFGASLGYGIFQAAGLLIVANVKISQSIIWVIQIFGATICGISASILWVSQGSYVSQVADANRKSELFGLFWGLMMSSQLFGNLLIIFILSKLGEITYFYLLTGVGFASSVLFLFLPSASYNTKAQQQQKKTTISEELKKIFVIIRNKKHIYLLIYFMFPGLTVSFYIGFLYKLVKGSLAQNADESDKHFKDRVNFDEGLVMVTLGISQALTGLLMNRFGEKFCKFKLATFGTLIAEVAGIFSLVCYFKKSFPLSFVCAALWGCSEAFLQSNTGGIIGKVFPGKVEGFSVYRIFFSIGVVSVLLLGVSLSHVDDYISLIVIVIFQAIFTGVSSNLRNLDKTESGDQHRDSLLYESDKQ